MAASEVRSSLKPGILSSVIWAGLNFWVSISTTPEIKALNLSGSVFSTVPGASNSTFVCIQIMGSCGVTAFLSLLSRACRRLVISISKDSSIDETAISLRRLLKSCGTSTRTSSTKSLSWLASSWRLDALVEPWMGSVWAMADMDLVVFRAELIAELPTAFCRQLLTAVWRCIGMLAP